jgi:alpha-D-xyloside xylohydrolase
MIPSSRVIGAKETQAVSANDPPSSYCRNLTTQNGDRKTMRRKPTLVAIAKWSLLGQGLLLALTPASWAQGNSGVTWEAQASPFQLSFRQSDRLLTSQRIGAAGAGSRLSYRLNDGTSHSLTNLISTETIPNRIAYSVATDEPNRTARVAVTQTPRGARVEWTFSGSNDIAQVFEALSASLSEHFLGTGARAQYVDLQRKVTPLKVHFVDAPLAGAHRSKNGA